MKNTAAGQRILSAYYEIDVINKGIDKLEYEILKYGLKENY
jgi:hypothetical protein